MVLSSDFVCLLYLVVSIVDLRHGPGEVIRSAPGFPCRVCLPLPGNEHKSGSGEYRPAGHAQQAGDEIELLVCHD